MPALLGELVSNASHFSQVEESVDSGTSGSVPKTGLEDSGAVLIENPSSDPEKRDEEMLRTPETILYPVERLRTGYQSKWKPGAGFQNVGNTCYLNSTLQALFHITVFVNWMVSEASHTKDCSRKDSCIICGMYETMHATVNSDVVATRPAAVYSKLRLICAKLTPGRQEDAHEFLRYLIEAMENCYLSRFTNVCNLDRYSVETTPLHQIFGGYLRSIVRCLTCGHVSTMFQHVQDLLLDIRKTSSLDDSLDAFFASERLEDGGYKCEACHKKVSATKQFYIEKAPMVLCIAFKRFSLLGEKLSKYLQFRKKISLAKYMFNKKNQQKVSYKLVSMVSHFGPSLNCGHYTAICQVPKGTFYQFDDSSTRPLAASVVLKSECYFMFYERDDGSSKVIEDVPQQQVKVERIKTKKQPIRQTIIDDTFIHSPMAVEPNRTPTVSDTWSVVNKKRKNKMASHVINTTESEGVNH